MAPRIPALLDTRTAAGHGRCPRCRARVWVSRCRTTAREICGSCGHEWSPGTVAERAGVA